MKALRIFMSLLLLGGLLSATPASAAVKSTDHYDIGDISPEHRFYGAIERFVYTDIIDGYLQSDSYEEDGEIYEYSYVDVRPDEKITRAQFTKILVNALSLKAGAKTKEFSDVKASKWYYDYVRIASSQGIISGYSDGNFHPGANITRDQMAAMIYRAFSHTITFPATAKRFKDVPSTSFAYEAVGKLAVNGIVQGYGDTFKPHSQATRGQAIAIMDRALHKESGDTAATAVITEVVDRNINEGYELTKEQNLSALEALYRETATGYYLSYSLESMGLLGDVEGAEETISIEPIGTHSLDIVTVRKRVAEVRIDNLNYKVSFTSPDMSFTVNMDASGNAYLKKGADGKWKIYNIILDEELGEEWMTEAAATANPS
ncbi:S-layer homology domain-containing protein [Bacillus sp. FJAT-42315]|uniref:S-layer homology domain-containing protein n=1 Tax=Bacillus sp. FJAT-42315 TaxID=2014077 RepID=UPI000C2322F7|nr:S-layer homology domain-containing protein [Bacillus sp. FJAT-42315]